MPRKSKLLLTLMTAGLVVNLIIGATVYSLDTAAQDDAEALDTLRVMMRAMMLIRQNYVDPEKTNYQSLIYNALQGMVSELDPYSGFMDAEDFERVRESTEGKFGGIGIIITMREGVLTVVSPIEDTPGSQAGLRAGDQIIAIDEESTRKMTMEAAVKRMKGEPGSKVVLEVYRPESEETMTLDIVRDLIEVSSIKDMRMLNDSVAYLRITQFDETTADRLGRALADLKEQGMQKLVLDLRNNPGGLLSSAIQVTSYFLPPRTLVVTTEGRDPELEQRYNTRRVNGNYEIPIAILINRGSASASEIVAGALRDHDLAVLVGDQTFGKGSVQSLIPLPDGSALRLTTAAYYTPKRTLIHEKGIEPDVEVKLTTEQIGQLMQAYQRAAETNGFIDLEDDPQLQKALALLMNETDIAKTAEGE